MTDKYPNLSQTRAAISRRKQERANMTPEHRATAAMEDLSDSIRMLIGIIKDTGDPGVLKVLFSAD